MKISFFEQPQSICSTPTNNLQMQGDSSWKTKCIFQDRRLYGVWWCVFHTLREHRSKNWLNLMMGTESPFGLCIHCRGNVPFQRVSPIRHPKRSAGIPRHVVPRNDRKSCHLMEMPPLHKRISNCDTVPLERVMRKLLTGVKSDRDGEI